MKIHIINQLKTKVIDEITDNKYNEGKHQQLRGSQMSRKEKTIINIWIAMSVIVIAAYYFSGV